jgi:hypothetical protein
MIKKFRRWLRGHTLEAYQRLRLEFELFNIESRNPTLVYQMGKVGSQTVERTLQTLDIQSPVIHVHTLNPDQLKKAIAKERQSHGSHLPAHLIASSILVRKLRNGLFPCRVITLTREPIARAVSFAFEDWKKKAPNALRENGAFDTDAVTEKVKRMLKNQAAHGDPSHWFDRELKEVLGIDVFAEPYDRMKGYTIIEGSKVSALVLRLEDMNRSLPDALSAFLGVEKRRVDIRSENVGDRKWYADSLQHVKDRFTLPPDLAQSVLDTRYVKHFYSPDAPHILDRWSANSDEPAS